MGIGEGADQAHRAAPRAVALNGPCPCSGRVPRSRSRHGTGPGTAQAQARTGTGRTVLGSCFFGPCQCRPVGPGPSSQLYMAVASEGRACAWGAGGGRRLRLPCLHPYPSRRDHPFLPCSSWAFVFFFSVHTTTTYQVGIMAVI